MTSLLRLALAAAALGARPAAADAPMQEMVAAGAFSLPDDHAGIVVLRSKDGPELLLPIVVGRPEAELIARRLRHEASPRPRTQDTLESAIGALGGKVVRVEIRDVSEAVFQARVFVAHGARRVALEARPSDSVALAIGSNAPIFVTAELLASSGLSRRDLQKFRDRSEGGDDEPKVRDVDM